MRCLDWWKDIPGIRKCEGPKMRAHLTCGEQKEVRRIKGKVLGTEMREAGVAGYCHVDFGKNLHLIFIEVRRHFKKRTNTLKRSV